MAISGHIFSHGFFRFSIFPLQLIRLFTALKILVFLQSLWLTLKHFSGCVGKNHNSTTKEMLFQTVRLSRATDYSDEMRKLYEFLEEKENTKFNCWHSLNVGKIWISMMVTEMMGGGGEETGKLF